MKKYKYTYSKVLQILFIVGIVVAVACLILNVARFISNFKGGYEITGYDWFLLAIVIALAIMFIVIAVSCLIKSYYAVVDNYVILSWGVIKNKLDLYEVTTVKYYCNKNRIELVFADESYFYLSTTASEVNDFVADVKKANKKIIYLEETQIESK